MSGETGDMSPRQRECQHEKFAASVDVHRLIDVGRFQCDVRVKCAECDVEFSFLGPPLGLLMLGPSVSVDRTELSIPIEPGPTPMPACGEMRFEVPQRVRES